LIPIHGAPFQKINARSHKLTTPQLNILYEDTAMPSSTMYSIVSKSI
jgi:hypothetical protein